MEVQIRAKFNYNAAHSDELSFKKKEILTLVSKLSDKGWWEARNASGESKGKKISTCVCLLTCFFCSWSRAMQLFCTSKGSRKVSNDATSKRGEQSNRS